MFEKIPDNISVTDAVYIAADSIAKEYNDAEESIIGTSVLGKKLVCLKIGSGKSCSLFVGAHHA
ncbi:MAG: hypothetical protein ACI4QR_00470, partial [Eubacteriales bacterium]